MNQLDDEPAGFGVGGGKEVIDIGLDAVDPGRLETLDYGLDGIEGVGAGNAFARGGHGVEFQ